MERETFSSKWGFILAAVGSAVGLGNIWRFPYLCGQYGGLSFILIYLLIILCICNPLMVSELALGRTSRSNFIDAYKVIGQKNGLKHVGIWSFFGGWVAFFGISMVISFYFLVAGWVLFYFLEAVSGKMLLIAPQNLSAEFDTLSRNFTIQYVCGLIFLLVTAIIVIGGVKKGIEKVSCYLMPVLFLMFIILCIRAVTLDGAGAGTNFLLHIDKTYWGFTENGFDGMRLLETFSAALGQAFISLSLGFGLLLVYGSYLSSKENLFSAVRQIEIFDTLAALLSAIIIIPAIFAVGLPPSSGPGLTFISLPLVFQRLSYGWFWSICFYLLLLLATITSTMSVFEGLTNLFMNKLHLKRFVAAIWVMLWAGTGFTLVTVSFSGAADIKILGKDIFMLFDWLSSTFTAAIVSLTMALFVGYKAMKPVIHNIRRNTTVSNGFVRYFLITLRYFAPIGLSVLLILGIYK